MRLAMAGLMLTFITAITAGFFVYQFMSDLTERMKMAFPAQSLRLESFSVNRTCINLSIRNSASVNAKVTGIHINDSAYSLAENPIIPSNNVAIVHLRGRYIEGETYRIEIIHSLGSRLKVDVKYE